MTDPQLDQAATIIGKAQDGRRQTPIVTWLNTSAARTKHGIPTEFRSVVPIIVGYPKGPTPATERRPPDIRHVMGGNL